jgi:hypothetical protein
MGPHNRSAISAISKADSETNRKTHTLGAYQAGKKEKRRFSYHFLYE